MKVERTGKSGTAKSGTHASYLHESLQSALDFGRNRAAALALTPEQLRLHADEEATFRQVSVDGNGFSDGMRLHVIEPARALLSEWGAARGPFDSAIRPKLSDLRALDEVDAQVIERKALAREQAAQAERKWEANIAHVDLRSRREEAANRYQHLVLSHGGRTANMRADNLLYWLALLCIGVAEWLINYDTFLLFFGIPAIAAGTTVILGVLLGFAAHGYGVLLKQWSFRFGQAQRTIDKFGGYRLLALSTLSLWIVLLCAGFSRYMAALRLLSSLSGGGGLLQQDLNINPLRDVLISLLANLGAWIVGVFLSYLCHDVDPDFMAATRQERRASRRLYRARRGVEDELRTIEARVEKDEREMRMAARSRVDRVREEQGLLDRLTLHETGLMEAIAATLRTNAEHYRDALARAALAKGDVTFTQTIDDELRPLTPYAFKSLPIRLNANDVRGLVQ